VKAALMAMTLVLLSAANVRAGSLAKWQSLPTPPALPPSDRSGYAPVNGIQMYYAVYGRGDPLLLIPIGMADADMWAAQIPALARHHSVIVADSRGHGRSSRTPEPYSYALLSADYLALLDYLRITKVALVGASDGAIIGLDIAINHPERLSKLFAQGANATLDGIFSEAADPTASKSASQLWEADYRRLSPTPDQFDAFHKAMNRMWESAENRAGGGRAACRHIVRRCGRCGVRLFGSESPLQGFQGGHEDDACRVQSSLLLRPAP
jgi:pimeloyl-ACP methyl ester carboxylesterase